VLTPLDRETLKELALESIRCGLREGCPRTVDLGSHPPSLTAPGAVFVTLTRHGQLRGCVGSYLARRPLAEDVAYNAFAAAFRDTRFTPLGEEELVGLEIHLSLLTPLTRLEVGSRDELLEVLRPGRDGVLLEDPPHRATFLPQVWKSLPDPEAFLRELFLKAGLPPDHWSSTLIVHRYAVEEF
jgi:AmmeMemoRadiSam system protein A